jgi:hypothetical protein
MKSRALTAVPLFAALACGPPVEPDGNPGALHFGAFEYCESKATCNGSPFPAHIAVGTSFVVSFSYAKVGSDGELLDTTTNDDGSATFRALTEGETKITARDDDGTLLDYVTVSTSDPTSLVVEQCPRSFNAIQISGEYFDSGNCVEAPPLTTLGLSRGSSIAPTLCLRLFDGADDELGGAPAANWSVEKIPARPQVLVPPDPSATLQLEVAIDTRCASVGALTTGDARLTVASLGLTTTVSATVVP